MKSNALKSFFWKIYIASVLLIFLTVVCVTVVFRNVQKNSYFSQLEREFKTEALLLSQLFSTVQNPFILEEWRLEGKPRITVMNEHGEVLLETMYNPFKVENQLREPEVLEALHRGWGKSVRWSKYTEMKMFFVAGYFHYNDQPDMIIRLALPVYEILRIVNHTTSTIILIGVFIFITVSLFGLIMTRGIAKPIMLIASYIKDFTGGNISKRIPLFQNKDLNLLSSELNRMIESITRGEGELNIVKDQTHKILASMHDGIILVDGAKIIRRANIAAGKILGIEAGDLIDKNVSIVISSDEIEKGIESVFHGSENVSDRICIHVPDERHIEFSCTPFGDKTGVLVVLHDITRIAKLERIRSEFVANVSHELKTPVTSVMGSVETILEMNPVDGKILDKFLNIINKNAVRMESIINDLLTLSKIESGVDVLPDRKIDVVYSIRKVIGNAMMRYPDRKIGLYGDEFSFFISGERSLIEIAIENLLDNALKYSSEDVGITIDGNYRKVFIAVEDRGIGIPKEDIERIFERFYRVDKARSRALGGTGLGLAIVKYIVETHKGRIRVKSALGEGSTFTVEFARHVEY